MIRILVRFSGRRRYGLGRPAARSICPNGAPISQAAQMYQTWRRQILTIEKRDRLREQQMDLVFDAQYLPVKNKFSEQGTETEVAYSPDGTVDYIYVVDQLLARPANIELLGTLLPG